MDKRKIGTFWVRSLDEFLLLMANADYVITNRVHGYIPALMYNRPVKFDVRPNKLDDRRIGVLEKFPIKKEGDFDKLDEEKMVILLENQKKHVEKIFDDIRKEIKE